jgi:cell wall-associated NlpC family hydrolase
MRWVQMLCLLGLAACGGPQSGGDALVTDTLMRSDSAQAWSDSMRAQSDSLQPPVDSQKTDGTRVLDTAVIPKAGGIDTRGVKPETLVAFAKTLIGTPYVYGSTDPKVGFDCSGFITYVFNHFNIKVPRSSIDFTAVGETVDTASARPGDLILFTGTTPEERDVGHMGIIVQRDAAGLQFIHSTSGKKMSVTITPLNEYYQKRFVRVARIF